MKYIILFLLICLVFKPYVSDIGDDFGASVASSSDGEYVIIGSPGYGSGSGAVYFFKKD